MEINKLLFQEAARKGHASLKRKIGEKKYLERLRAIGKKGGAINKKRWAAKRKAKKLSPDSLA